MIFWYADNSELNGIKNSEIPDIHIFGGLIIDENIELELRRNVEIIKKKYGGDKRLPIKWNFKDLKNIYTKRGKQDKYDLLNKNITLCKEEIFSEIAKYDFKVIISCIESHSQKRKIISSLKNDYTHYLFSNCLMRFGLEMQERNKDKNIKAAVILDWPDANNPELFYSEYVWAFNVGKTSDKSTTYNCGPLKDLGFHDSIFFTTMKNSTKLQVADLIVGAFREFVEECLEKKCDALGTRLTKMIIERYRDYPNVIGRGIIVSSSSYDLTKKINEKIIEIKTKPNTR